MRALILLTLSPVSVLAQDSGFTRPPLTATISAYRAQVRADPSKKMIEIHSLAPTIQYDLRYAGKQNFMHRAMYPAGTHVTFLRLPVATALAKVQEMLNATGLGLKIFDAYRPYSVTVKFWELVHDDRYVANPSKGSGHNRGVAVDLTLVNLRTKKELDMGTGFDNFSDTAHSNFSHLPESVLQNRQLLKTVMEKNGFRQLDTEWWHFSWPNAEGFEVLDLPFDKLKDEH